MFLKLFKSDAFFVFLGRLISRGAMFFVLVIISAFMSLEDVGFYGILSSAAYIGVFLFNLGLRQSIAYFFAKEVFSHDKLINVAFLSYLLLSLSGLFALYTYGVFFVEIDNVGLSVIAVFSISIIPMLFTYLVQGFFLGAGNISSFNNSEMLPKVTFLMLILLSVITLNALTLDITFISFLAANIIGAVYSLKKIGITDLKVKIHRDSASDVLLLVKHGLPFSINLVLMLVIPFATVFIAKSLYGAAVAGIYFLAYKFVDIFAEISTATGMVAFSRGIRASSSRRSIVLALTSSWILFFLTLCCSTILFVVFYLFGEKLAGIALDAHFFSITLVLFSLPFLCFTRVIGPALSAHGIAGKVALVQFANLAFLITTTLISCHYFSFTGLGIGFFTARILSFILHLTLLCFVFNFSFFTVVIPKLRNIILFIKAYLR